MNTMKVLSLSLILLFAKEPAEASVRALRKRELQLQLMAFGGEPDASRFPLQLCQGDCDEDDECDDGLVCFQRDAPPPGGTWPEVPGCIGGGDFAAQTDFCIALVESTLGAPTNAPTKRPTQAPTEQPSLARSGVPTEEVQSTGPTTEMPSMGPSTAAPSLVPSSAAYWKLPELDFVGNDGNLQGMPLGVCQGDCDTDEDCLDELVCFQRALNEPIPACRGDGMPSMDYCILPPVQVLPDEPTEAVTMAPTIAETLAATEMLVALQTVGDSGGLPLGLCQGDCDVDEDCLDDLICFQRSFVESVPGCAGQGFPSYDYCIMNPDATTSSPTTQLLLTSAPSEAPFGFVVAAAEEQSTDLPSQAPSVDGTLPLLATVHKQKDEPLGHCEGKCNSDDDCEGDLICMDRDSEDEVPGCAGDPRKADNYCVEP